MHKKNMKYVWGIIAFIVVAAPLGYWYNYQKQPGTLDNFAQCLGTKGAKFYGAYWCPHCQAQKALFGKSKDLLPYVECSEAGGQTQTAICLEKKIENYPTWEFVGATGTERVTGEKTLKELSEKTGCVLPN